MPWYSSVAARENGGVEVAVHYELYRGPNDHSISKRQSSAAILTIDKDNVNVIGTVVDTFSNQLWFSGSCGLF